MLSMILNENFFAVQSSLRTGFDFTISHPSASQVELCVFLKHQSRLDMTASVLEGE
jgi:hypothetical protein